MPATDRQPSIANRRHLPDSSYELKFAIDDRQATTVRGWLRSICPQDPAFPRGIVNSIYYDTPALQHLHEKINSDYFKTKIRLRWCSVAGRPSLGSFLEAKFRIGPRRQKIRLPMPFEGRWLSKVALDDLTLRAIPEQLRQQGVPVPGILRPVILIRYRRDRFIDPTSRVRISLDAEISAPAVNRETLSVPSPLPLETAVVEVKGREAHLPPLLRHLANLGARKVSFSKYLACYDHTVNMKVSR